MAEAYAIELESKKEQRNENVFVETFLQIQAEIHRNGNRMGMFRRRNKRLGCFKWIYLRRNKRISARHTLLSGWWSPTGLPAEWPQSRGLAAIMPNLVECFQKEISQK